VARHGRRAVATYAAAAQDYTERVLRQAIREIPDGVYTCEDALEDDGFGHGPLPIRVALEIAGDEARVDFTGSSPQVEGGINANDAITLSATLYAFRCLVRDDVLYNSGIARPLRVVAPAGTIVNASRPAAVAGGNVETSQRITDVVLGALARALPDRMPAASQGTMNNVTLGGVDPATGRRFAYYETLGGGMGGRPGLAGLTAVHVHMSNTRNTPIEALEHALPVRVREYSVRAGSGGAGEYAGGDGLVREFELLVDAEVNLLTERRASGPPGARGGEPGRAGRNLVIRRDGSAEMLPGKARIWLRAGDRLRIETPGGGGYGRKE
jgi:N-methylhydantoinase B/oxoprolinase/acetone carboxylase alpha subunit